ncbi:hypothetical protein PUN28_018373 [Cardiocondyla obscurior]|uniref:Uncharacterized protein n=1 Tax=Cardiocondyla obscurior TaxID=286306 RepID=A0AAW2EI46_9HYME
MTEAGLLWARGCDTVRPAAAATAAAAAIALAVPFAPPPPPPLPPPPALPEPAAPAALALPLPPPPAPLGAPPFGVAATATPNAESAEFSRECEIDGLLLPVDGGLKKDAILDHARTARRPRHSLSSFSPVAPAAPPRPPRAVPRRRVLVAPSRPDLVPRPCLPSSSVLSTTVSFPQNHRRPLPPVRAAVERNDRMNAVLAAVTATIVVSSRSTSERRSFRFLFVDLHSTPATPSAHVQALVPLPRSPSYGWPAPLETARLAPLVDPTSPAYRGSPYLRGLVTSARAQETRPERKKE